MLGYPLPRSTVYFTRMEKSLQRNDDQLTSHGCHHQGAVSGSSKREKFVFISSTGTSQYFITIREHSVCLLLSADIQILKIHETCPEMHQRYHDFISKTSRRCCGEIFAVKTHYVELGYEVSMYVHPLERQNRACVTNNKKNFCQEFLNNEMFWLKNISLEGFELSFCISCFYARLLL